MSRQLSIHQNLQYLPKCTESLEKGFSFSINFNYKKCLNYLKNIY